uniref:Uncharacterized protein n=1 Tax=Zalerion maritima TaxID=339359 RepID=A0AAD5WUS1_9PEZI|nr:hypothetical protein MKZ38_002634 [Zalerion maritima]
MYPSLPSPAKLDEYAVRDVSLQGQRQGQRRKQCVVEHWNSCVSWIGTFQDLYVVLVCLQAVGHGAILPSSTKRRDPSTDEYSVQSYYHLAIPEKSKEIQRNLGSFGMRTPSTPSQTSSIKFSTPGIQEDSALPPYFVKEKKEKTISDIRPAVVSAVLAVI